MLDYLVTTMLLLRSAAALVLFARAAAWSGAPAPRAPRAVALARLDELVLQRTGAPAAETETAVASLAAAALSAGCLLYTSPSPRD